MKGPLPSITPVQIAAVLKWLLAVGLALGLHPSAGTQAEIIGSASLLAVVLTFADLHLRRGRQLHLGHLLPGADFHQLEQLLLPPARKLLEEIDQAAKADAATQRLNDPETPAPGTAPVQLADLAAGEPTGS